MSTAPATLESAGFTRAINQYCDLKKNVDRKKELRRRAKNVGMRLAKLYKDKGVSLPDITAKVKALGGRLRIRPKIRGKKGISYKQMITRELRARRSAKGFTATGWFPSITKLGGSPRDTARRTGPQRGKLIEKFGLSEMSETLVNQQPGAVHVHDKNKALMQQALDAETDDLIVYINRKQQEAARRNGL